VVGRVAQFGRDVGLQHVGLDGLGHAGIHHLHQAGDVHGQHQIGGRAVALGHQTLGHALVDEGHVHRDAGLGGEGIDQRLDQFRLAVGIDVDLIRRHRQRRGQERRKGRQAKRHG